MVKKVGESTADECMVGFLSKLSTIDDVAKYRGISTDGILSSGIS